MIINLTYEANADIAPAGFKPCVQAAVDFLCARFQGGAPLNITCGFGTVGGIPMQPSPVGNSIAAPSLTNISYSSVRAAIIGKAHTANAVSAAGSLPSGADPNSGQLLVHTALAKTLGIIPADGSVDGFIGINSNKTLDFSTVNGATPVGFSCFAAALHEITENLGRISGDSSFPGDHVVMDFFSYTALNVREWIGANPRHFSINSGATLLKLYNFVPTRDFGDWDSGPDACIAATGSNTAGPWSATDDIVMDALGYGFGPPFTQRMTWS